MHIPVRDILAQDLGYQKSFEVADEQPELEDIRLVKPITGSVDVRRLEDGVGASGRFHAVQLLECHRCLQDYEYEQEIAVQGEFKRRPTGEALPVAADLTIDLAPLVRQEIILGIPLKQLCRSDCPGLDPTTGKAYESIIQKS